MHARTCLYKAAVTTADAISPWKTVRSLCFHSPLKCCAICACAHLLRQETVPVAEVHMQTIFRNLCLRSFSFLGRCPHLLRRCTHWQTKAPSQSCLPQCWRSRRSSLRQQHTAWGPGEDAAAAAVCVFVGMCLNVNVCVCLWVCMRACVCVCVCSHARV